MSKEIQHLIKFPLIWDSTGFHHADGAQLGFISALNGEHEDRVKITQWIAQTLNQSFELQSEVERLQRENGELKDSLEAEKFCEICRETAPDLSIHSMACLKCWSNKSTDLQAENLKLREALGKYADSENWTFLHKADCVFQPGKDGWEIAEEVLKEIDQ